MKRILFTICLLILLAASVVTVTAMFISGPAIKYDTEIENEISQIKEKNGKVDLTEFHRHVIRYVTYTAAADDYYIWFDREGKELLRREKASLQMEEAKQTAMSLHNLTEGDIFLGYGFDNAAYVLETDACIVLLDLDTMEQIYYRRK